MRCDEVRAELPGYVDRDLHSAGEVEVHLASCGRCSADLAGYRELLASLDGLRQVELDAPQELLNDVLALIPPPSVRGRVLGVVGERRLVMAIASLGGAAVGATALALVWWRLAHRAAGAGDEPSATVAL